MAIIPSHPRSPAFVPEVGEISSRSMQEPSLGHYLDVLKRHALLIFAITLLCGGLAALASYSMKPIYQAKASIELQVPPSPERDADAFSALAGQSFDAYLQTQIGILESESLTRRVVDELQLEKRLNAYKPQGLVALRRRYLPFIGSGGHVTREEAYGIAGGNLKVRQARMNNLIEVVYNSEDPRLAADFVNSLCDNYARQNLESRWDLAQRSGKWLSRQLDDLRTKMEKSEAALQEYRRENSLLLVAGDSNSLEQQRLQQLQEELSRAQADRILRQSQLDMALSTASEVIPQVIDDTILKEYQMRASELRRRLAELRETFTPASPRVQAVEAQLATLEAASRKQQSSIVERLRNEYKAAQRREESLRAEYASQSRVVSGQDEKMIRHDTLKHEVDTNRATYEAVLQRIKQSAFSVALQATNSRVVDPAMPPGGPYKPNHKIHIAAGLLSGILLGLASMALHQRADTRVSHPGAVAQVTGARALGIIPGDDFLSSAAAASKAPGVSARPSGGAGARLLTAPNSVTAESFRSVAVSILLSRKEGEHRILTVTSPGPNEGKTTIASNLAVAFATAGCRVLLVDADVRRPRLHSVFSADQKPGLLELTTEASRGAVRLDDYIRPTHVRNVSLMPSGDTTTGETYLSQMLEFSGLFSGLRDSFDVVLIDSPPILCVPEARILAGAADGVVMVVRSGDTKLEDIAEAEQYIQQDGGQLVGTVLNDTSRHLRLYYDRYLASA